MTTKQAFGLMHIAAGLLALSAAVAEARMDKSISFDPDPFWEQPAEVDTSLRWLPKTPLFEDGGPRMICDRDGNW